VSILKGLPTLVGHLIPFNHRVEEIIWDVVSGKNLKEKITELESLSNDLVYKGTWDASTGMYPTPASYGDWWIVSVDGSAGGLGYSAKDWIIHNGSVFEKVDNTDSVKTVNNIAPINGNITITKADIGLSEVQNIKHNFTAISNPNHLSDSTMGYSD